MTGPHGPDLDLLAELDAGLLEPGRAAQVREAALADPRSAAVLTALAATRAELAALPAPPVPAQLASRWAAALAAESAGGPGADDALKDSTGRRGHGQAVTGHLRDATDAPPAPRGARPSTRAPAPRPATERSRRASRRRPAVAVGVLLAGLGTVGVLWLRPAAAPPVDRVDLAAAGRAALGAADAGALADPVRRAGCLAALAPPGVEPDSPLLGGRRVELDGHTGVLLVLTTGELGTFRIVVVDPECGPGGGTLLGSAVVGR